MSALSTPFKQILAARHSCRGFKKDLAVPKATITSILEDAQRSCSNCNTQPWHVAIVSGAKLEELKKAYVEDFKANGFNTPMDFVFSTDLFTGAYKERQQDQGKTFFEAAGIGRGDTDARTQLLLDNFVMYDAPHVALLFMPDIQEGNVRQASDVGQYGMTFMLSCAAHGLGSLPQTILGMKPDVPRKVLGTIPEGYKMLYGISFGYEDETAPGNSFRIKRAPIEESVHFYE